MKNFIVSLGLLFSLHGQPSIADTHSHHTESVAIQHGFILGKNNTVASHLVAKGHHSWQSTVSGSLVIEDSEVRSEFLTLQKQKATTHYFLFQAQKLQLENIAVGMTLKGHVIMSELGKYEPQNTVLEQAEFKVEDIWIHQANPFFQ